MHRRGETPGTPYDTGPGDGQLSATDRLRRAVIAVADGSGASDAFQGAARELVAEWRRANIAPEQIVLRVKQIPVDAGLRPSYATPVAPAAPIGAQTEVYRDVMAWTIHHCYEEESQA